MNQIITLISGNLHIYEIIVLTTTVSIYLEHLTLSTSGMYIVLSL